jgi:hypothetical protein
MLVTKERLLVCLVDNTAVGIVKIAKTGSIRVRSVASHLICDVLAVLARLL